MEHSETEQHVQKIDRGSINSRKSVEVKTCWSKEREAQAEKKGQVRDHKESSR